MKNFLKKYLWLIITLIVEIILFVAGTIFFPCLILATFSSGIIILFFAGKSKQKLNDLKDKSEDEEDSRFFDATKLDFDEDIYYLGEGDKSAKIKSFGKSIFSKLSIKMPTIILSIFGVALICFSLIGLVKIFL